MDTLQLPRDWKKVKLGEVCHTTSGGTPSRRELKYYTGNIPWVKSGELDRGIITDTEEKISEEAIKNSSAKVFPKGTLLIALYGATIGKLAFLGVDAATNQAICGIYKNENIDSHFLYNYLFYKKQKLVNQGIGGAQPNISQTILKNLDIPLPPKPTQQAIVSKIEELFSELDKGIENLHTAQQQLKTYRQAVLKWAFEGKLTNGNVKDGELPKGWKRIELGTVCSLITDGKHGDCDNEENSGYYFLSAKDVRNNTLLWANARQITKTGFEETHRRTNLKPGDICLVNTGATIGRISVAPNDERTFKSTFQKSVAVIKCIPALIDNRYCSYLLQGDLKKLVKVSSGTAVPNLLLGSLKKHNINLPPHIEEQSNIVQAIESRLSVADKMEETITQSLQQAEALRQSILKKAFEGKLVL